MTSPAEREAQERMAAAEEALKAAIAAMEAAGYGSHVTDPMRDALMSAQFALDEVQS